MKDNPDNGRQFRLADLFYFVTVVFIVLVLVFGDGSFLKWLICLAVALAAAWLFDQNEKSHA